MPRLGSYDSDSFHPDVRWMRSSLDPEEEWGSDEALDEVDLEPSGPDDWEDDGEWDESGEWDDDDNEDEDEDDDFDDDEDDYD